MQTDFFSSSSDTDRNTTNNDVDDDDPVGRDLAERMMRIDTALAKERAASEDRRGEREREVAHKNDVGTTLNNTNDRHSVCFFSGTDADFDALYAPSSLISSHSSPKLIPMRFKELSAIVGARDATTRVEIRCRAVKAMATILTWVEGQMGHGTVESPLLPLDDGAWVHRNDVARGLGHIVLMLQQHHHQPCGGVTPYVVLELSSRLISCFGQSIVCEDGCPSGQMSTIRTLIAQCEIELHSVLGKRLASFPSHDAECVLLCDFLNSCVQYLCDDGHVLPAHPTRARWLLSLSRETLSECVTMLTRCYQEILNYWDDREGVVRRGSEGDRALLDVFKEMTVAFGDDGLCGDQAGLVRRLMADAAADPQNDDSDQFETDDDNEDEQYL